MAISSLGTQTYTEQQGVITLANATAISGGGNYGTGFVQFGVTQAGDGGDILRLTSASDPNASGAVSITGSTVYLGLGASKMQIGTVDAVNNGLAGKPLKINFDNATLAGTSPVLNGDFSQGLTGWTSVLSHINLGVTTIAGFATPEAPTILYPSRTPGGDDNDLSSGFDAPQVLINAGRLQLQETNLLSPGFGVIHGPAAYSNVFNATAGMVLKFDWSANRVNDDYHVVGYLLNATTGQISIALQGWGSTGSGVGSVVVPSSGDYRFVFVSGTYDASGGTVLGASMFIDNIRVEAPAVVDSVVQALARQVTYENVSDAPGAPVKTVTVTTRNIGGEIANATLPIAVTPVDDNPVGTATAVLPNGTEDVAYTVSASTLLAGFSDPDGDALTVTQLAASKGTVTANANGTFTITQAKDFNGPVVLTYAVSDGQGATVPGSRSFNVLNVNDAPTGAGGTILPNGTEDQAYQINTAALLAGFTDVDGDALSITALSADRGTVQKNADGSYTVTPPADATGAVNLKYNVVDGKGGTVAATLAYQIDGVNDAPVAVADSAVAAEDGGPIQINVLANDTDVDAGDAKTLAAVTAGTHGATAVNADGTIAYTLGAGVQALGAGQSVTDSFSYTIVDSEGAASTSTVTVTIQGVNDAPVAQGDTASVGEDDVVSISVLDNDSDVDNYDTLSVSSVSGGSHGAVQLNGDGTIGYTPGPALQVLRRGQRATDSFSYTLVDAAGASSTGTVNVTIVGANDVPVTGADVASTTEDAAVSINVLANDTDVDAGDSKTLSAVSAGTHGATAVNADGTIGYTPDAALQALGAGHSVTDVFTYTMVDGEGATGIDMVTVTIHGVNDAPVAQGDTASLGEDDVVVINVLANDSDIDNYDTRTVSSVSAGSHGATQLNADGTIAYTPGAALQALRAGQTATDSFSYTLVDAAGTSSTATVNVTIVGTNDGPVAVADVASATEDAAVSIDVLANDTDVDAGDSKTVTAVSTAVHGATAVNADGTIGYTPDAALQSLGAGQSVTDTFTYTMVDGEGATSSNTVTVTIQGVNDAPVAQGDTATVGEDGSVTLNVRANDSDIDNGDSIRVAAVSSGARGAAQLNADGTVTYTPGAGLQSLRAGDTATDSFSYTLVDAAGASSTASVNVTIIGANDAPTVQTPTGPTQNAFQGKAYQFSLPSGLFNDVDGETLSLSASLEGGGALPAWLTFNAATGAFTGTPTGVDDYLTLQVRAADPAGESATFGFVLRIGRLLEGGNGPDTLTGGRGNDVILGGNGPDRLSGGEGDDRLIGGHGPDYLIGGSGRDTFVLEKSGGPDTVADFQIGVDRLELDGVAYHSHSFSDTDRDGRLDAVIQLDNGSVTLLGVTSISNVQQLFLA